MSTNHSPIVSIIVPAYCAEHTIERCVGSLLCQTVPDIEIIVVDDGSPDATLSILQRMAGQDPRLVVVHQDNAGVSAARNKGLTVARAPWVAFVDSDDYVTDDYIETLLPKSEDVDFTVCSLFNEYPDGRKIEYNPLSGTDTVTTMSIAEMMIVGVCYVCVSWCKLFSLSVLKSQSITFPIDMSFGEDAVFVFTYLQHVEKLQVSHHASYFYTHNKGESLSQNATSVQWADMGMKIFALMTAICDRHYVANRWRVERHLVDRLTTALALNRHDHCMTRHERHKCYDMIAHNVSYSNYHKSLPCFFPVFAVLRWWNVYEWLVKKIYR